MGKELDQLKPVLEAIPREEVAAPQIPIAVFLQEAHDLGTLSKEPEVKSRLVAVGLAAKTIADLGTAVAAARQAQSDWVVAFDRTKSDAYRSAAEQARALRGEITAACRWNLRGDRVALATVNAIAPEDGQADLVQDLIDLAQLLETRQAAFKGDSTFEAAPKAKQARQLARDLQQGISKQQLKNDQAAAKELRDRAFTHLFDEVNLVREAGRYAFRNDPRLLPRFYSTHSHHRTRAVVQESAPVAPVARPEPAAAS